MNDLCRPFRTPTLKKCKPRPPRSLRSHCDLGYVIGAFQAKHNTNLFKLMTLRYGLQKECLDLISLG